MLRIQPEVLSSLRVQQSPLLKYMNLQALTWTIMFMVMVIFKVMTMVMVMVMVSRSRLFYSKRHLAGVSLPCSVRTSQKETQEDITMMVSGMYLI